MSVWFCIPSARSPEEAEPVLRQWRERGYKIALWTDSYAPGLTPHYRIREIAHVEMQDRPENYPGYAVAVNTLVGYVIKHYEDAEWLICTGDDTLPDPNKSAEEIARECNHHFSLAYALRSGQPHDIVRDWPDRTFGVMQPTGDRFADGSIDRICGSPWMGREFCKRMYGGKGPLWPEYTRFFMDEELQCVSQKLGVLWQRPDLTHFHQWYGREGNGTKATDIPPHLKNQQARWEPEKKIFNDRKAASFPGSKPL